MSRGAGRLVRRRLPPGIKERDFSRSFNKKAQVCLRHAWALDAWSLALLQLINQEIYSVSAPFRIMRGCLKTHISYMGIANMIMNEIVMSTSPVNSVTTKREDT